MLIYKKDKSCNCDLSQLPTMKKAGWSTEKPITKPEGDGDGDGDSGKVDTKGSTKPAAKK